MFPLFLLGVDQLLRQLAHLPLGFFRAALQYTQANDDHHRHDDAQKDRLPEQPLQLRAKRDVAPGYLLALTGHVRVVQLFDFLRDRQRRLAPRHHFTPEEGGTPKNLLAGRPVEQRVEGRPVVVQFRLQAGDAVIVLHQRAKLRQRGHVGLTELGELLAVLGRALPLDVEQIVPDENARQVDVGAQFPEVGLHAAMMSAEVIELRVDLLRPPRRHQHRHGNEDDETAEPERSDQPGFQPHVASATVPPAYDTSGSAGIRQTGETECGRAGPCIGRAPCEKCSTPLHTRWRGARRRGLLTLSAIPMEVLMPWNQAIVLSNRGPISHDRSADGMTRTRRSAGGLVTALDPLVQACSATWVACGTQAGDTHATAVGGLDIRSATSRYRLRHVCLSEEEYRGYYYGFANEGLWPLCHGVGVQPVFRTHDFLTYRSANVRFATATADEATCAAPLLLVQDYHFALAPRELRHRLPLSTIVTFWHIPWPPLHVLRVCPWARDLVYGLLGSDIVGFQTPLDCENFLTSVEKILGSDIDRMSGTVMHRGQRTQVRSYPVGIEWNNDIVRAAPPVSVCRDQVRRDLALTADVRLGVGVDRLDYTKGINEKLLAIERVLEQHPELRGRFTFVQVAEPSRECLPEYRSAREQIRATAQRVNERFAGGENQPILLRESHHEPAE